MLASCIGRAIDKQVPLPALALLRQVQPQAPMPQHSESG